MQLGKCECRLCVSLGNIPMESVQTLTTGLLFPTHTHRHREKGLRTDQKDQKCAQNWDLSRSVMASGRGAM